MDGQEEPMEQKPSVTPGWKILLLVWGIPLGLATAVAAALVILGGVLMLIDPDGAERARRATAAKAAEPTKASHKITPCKVANGADVSAKAICADLDKRHADTDGTGGLGPAPWITEVSAAGSTIGLRVSPNLMQRMTGGAPKRQRQELLEVLADSAGEVLDKQYGQPTALVTFFTPSNKVLAVARTRYRDGHVALAWNE